MVNLLGSCEQDEHADKWITDGLEVSVIHVLREQIVAEQGVCRHEEH